VLQDALDVVVAREPVYGNPTPNYTQLAGIWGAMLGIHLTAQQVGLMMIAMKLNREWRCHQWDNLVDIAGYAENIGRIIEDQQHDHL